MQSCGTLKVNRIKIGERATEKILSMTRVTS